MNSISSATIVVQRVATPDALNTLLQSFDGLPNIPASLYLSSSDQDLVVYVAPTRVVNTISLSYLAEALRQKDESASTLKSFLETGTATKVFFDARTTAKTLFDRCAIRLSNPPSTKRAHIHEVQLLEIALRPSDTDREWLAGFDKCIRRDSDPNIDLIVVNARGGSNRFDKRILHLPVLWRKYYDQLHANRNGFGERSFWVAQIREETRTRLAVACGEEHPGYNVDSALSPWDSDILDEKTESWNDDVLMDNTHNGEWVGGAGHWAKFEVL